MLYKNAVDESTLGLLKSIQSKDYSKGFYLVGGTALSLYMGHRKSIDLDLFSNFSFDSRNLLEQIHQDHEYQILQTATNTLRGRINFVNVDFIAHRYPWIGDPVIHDKISLASIEDILAMKINAITTSGQRSKDYIDVYFALEKFSLEELLELYQKKYGQESRMPAIKSLMYFDDVDLSDWPVLLKKPDLKWKQLKIKLETEVSKILQI